jgi:hypothetical protein
MGMGAETIQALKQRAAAAGPGGTIGINAVDILSLRGMDVKAWREAIPDLGEQDAEDIADALLQGDPDLGRLDGLIGARLVKDPDAPPLVPEDDGGSAPP